MQEQDSLHRFAIMLLSFSYRRSYLTLLLGIYCLIFALSAASNAEARKYAALVMDASTGEVLHSRRANDLRHPASITKVMTLYMLFDAIERGKYSMNSKLKVSRMATRAPPSRLGLPRGGSITVKDAIGTLITKSANDVAVVVAEALGGSEANFAKMMTKKAHAMGMTRTTFRNASGLHHSRQTSTAKDIATLAQRIRKDFPQYYYMFKWRYYTYNGRKYRNHNKLLGNYPGMEGLKTGFINASGFNLVAVAKRNNRRVITVVFGGRSGKSRDRQVRKLMDLGFSRLPHSTVMHAPVRSEQQMFVKEVLQAPMRLVALPPSTIQPDEQKTSKRVLPKSEVESSKNASLSNNNDLGWEDIKDASTKERSLELNFTVIE